jgi:HD domain
MRLVAVDGLAGELELARGVPSDRPDGAPLLRAGTRVSAALAARLASAGASRVWVEDELGSAIEPPPEFPADVIGLSLQAFKRAQAAVPAALRASRGLEAPALRALQEAAGEIADAVLDYPREQCPISDFAVTLASPSWHALRVALLGTFIGRRVLAKSGWIDVQGVQRFDAIDERLSALALGLLVHDIALPAPAAQADAMPAEAEQPVSHVNLAASLFAAESFPAAMRVVLQSHHERWDGMGYPERKHRDATALNARIAAIADAFDSLTASGEGREPLAVDAAVRAIEAGAGAQFDPSLVAHFRELVPPYPLGHPVRLPDGREGVVVSLAAADRLHPTVRLRSASGPIVELVADLSPADPAPPQVRAAA